MFLLPLPIMAQQEDLRGIIRQQVTELHQIPPPGEPLEGIMQQVTEEQNIDLTNYTELGAMKSLDNHTVIAQVDFTGATGNTTIQANELIDLIDQAKAKCWRITGFTGLDPFLFVLLEAFRC